MSPLNATSGSKFYLFLLLSLYLIVSCSINSSDDEVVTDCYLEEIRFDEVNSLQFQTISGGQIYRMFRLYIIDGETNILDSYQFKYFEDSLAVIDQGNTFSTEPYLSIRFEGDRPVEVIRYFYSAGVKLFHHITYLQDNQIRIDLSRLDSLGDLLYVGYSLYYLNSEGNVVRNARFRADPDDSTSVMKVEDRTFTYDSFQSPHEDLFLPYFADANFADVKFFSDNNILTFSENNQTYEYRYEYGLDENVVTQILPSGESLSFSYANCSE